MVKTVSLVLDEQDLFRADGTGLSSGVRYKFFENGTPFSYLEQRKQTLIGLGGAPDQVLTYYILLVIDGVGNVTVDIFDVNLECNPGE